MKKAFTLVEMLVVVVVLVTLMSITFRLSSIGEDQTCRNTTIARLQRLENCLSGYYAAFGTYPPVQLHGSRNIYSKVNDYGIQSKDQENQSIWGWDSIGQSAEEEAWRQVKAACKAQPVGCRFPYPADSAYNEMVKSISDELKKLANDRDVKMSDSQRRVLSAGFDNGVTDDWQRHELGESDWRDCQLFQFGLMSFLLPRYLVMMSTRREFFNAGVCKQWEGNNTRPCDAMTGKPMTFSDMWSYNDNPKNKMDYAKMANIPSQSVCARWMPNLAGSVSCNHAYKLFGIDIRGEGGVSGLRSDNVNIEVFMPGGYNGSGMAYVLDGLTMIDGWWNEFYYYSMPPYQNYTLWSSGPNGRTFPPWVSRESLDSKANKCVGLWIEDDIVRMSN